MIKYTKILIYGVCVMLLQIWEIIVNITEPLFLFFILNKKLELRKNSLPFAILGMLVIAAVTTVMNKVGLDFLPTILVCYAEYICFAFLLFKGNPWMKIMWSTLYVFSVVSANMIVAPVLIAFSSAAQFFSQTFFRFIPTFSYVLLNGFIVFLIIRFNETDRYIPDYIKISIVALALIGCTSLYLLMNHIVVLSEHGMQVWIGVILSSTILLLILALLFFMDRISRSAKRMNDQQVELARANSELEYNAQVSAVINTFREIKHDYVSHITAINAYAQAENWDALKKYLSDFNDEYGVEKYFISTGNRTFDAIVTSKALICSGKGIDFDFTALLPPALPFSDMETAALFGNLLDNAINAQESVETKKYIQLEVQTKGKMLSIRVVNSSDGNYRYVKGELATSNSDRVTHGLGLKRIRSIAETHGGNLTLSPEDDKFTAIVIVPLE